MLRCTSSCTTTASADGWWGHYEPPVEGERARARAASPAGVLVPNRDAADGWVSGVAQQADAVEQDAPRFAPIPALKGGANRRFVVGRVEAHVDGARGAAHRGLEGAIDGEGVPLAAVGQALAIAHRKRSTAGASDAKRVFGQPLLFVVQEAGGLTDGGGLRQDDLQAVAGMDLDTGVAGAGGTAHRVGSRASVDEDGAGGGVVGCRRHGILASAPPTRAPYRIEPACVGGPVRRILCVQDSMREVRPWQAETESSR